MTVNKLLGLMILGALAAAILFVYVYPLLTRSARAAERRMAIVRGEVKKTVARDAEAASRRRQVAESLKELENREKKSTKLSLEMKLEQAGLDITEKFFIQASVGCAVFLGFVAFFLLGPLYGLGGLLIGGLGLPNWIVSYLKEKRIKDFLKEFPTAIEVIIRGVKSGLPLGACLQTVAVQAQEPVRSEFELIVASTNVGLTAAEGIERLAQRVPLPETSFFAIVVNIQQKAGGNLTEALGNLSQVLRDRITMELKVKALSSEAKTSSWIIGSLPVIISSLIYFSSPAYLEPLWTTDTGQKVLTGVAIWMSLGIFFLRQMTNFKT